MCDGGSTHTHLLHAHCSALHCAHSAPLMRVHIHAWLKVKRERCLLHAHVVSLHLAFSVLMSHPSLLFPDVTSRPFSTLTSTTFLPSITRLKSAAQAHFRTSTEEFGYLAKSDPTTGDEPNSSTRTLLWTMTRRQQRSGPR